MKKLVKLISVVMLIAMCFSLVSANAFADNGVVVIGGAGNSSSSESAASFSYGGNVQAVTDSTGGMYVSGSSKQETTLKSDGVTVLAAPAGTVFASDVEAIDFSQYTSADENVSYNINYIKYVLSGYSNGTIALTSQEMITAKSLFGDVIDYGVNQIIEMANEVAKKAAAVTTTTANETEKEEEEVEKVSDSSDATLDSSVEAAGESVSASTETVGSTGATLYASDVKTQSDFLTDKGYDNLAKAISAAGKNGTVNVISGTMVLTSSYDGDIVFNLNGVVINNNDSGTALVKIESGLFNFQNGVINGDGFYVEGSEDGPSHLYLESMKLNVGAGNSAVTIRDYSYVDMEDSVTITGTTQEDPAEDAVPVDIAGGATVVMGSAITGNNADCAVLIEGSATVTITGAGTADTDGIYAKTGIKVKDSATLVVTGGSITGTATPSDENDLTGAAIAVYSDSAYVSINPEFDCEIHSYNNGATRLEGKTSTHVDGDGDGVIVVSKLSVLAPESKSNYASSTAIAIVDGVEYATMEAALTAAMTATNKTVTLLRNASESGGLTIDENYVADGVVINGDGYEYRNDGGVTIDAEGCNIVLENIRICGDGQAEKAIAVSNGVLTMQNVYADHATTALYVEGGAVSADGFYVDYDITGSIGIDCQGGTTSIFNCTIDCEIPVNGTTGLNIYQGAFRIYENDTDNATGLTNVKTAAIGSILDENGYRKVVANEFDLQIIYGGDSTGSYLTYSKAASKTNSTDEAVQFLITDGKGNAVTIDNSAEFYGGIYAIGSDGLVHQLSFTQSSNQKYVTITEQTLNALPAGKYDLCVKAKDSGIIHIDLYVSPTTTLEFDGHNGKVNNSTDKIPVYNAQSGKNGKLTITSSTSDEPLHVGVGADRYSVTWLSDACFGTDENKNVSFLLLHDDLDYLSNGTNYVWLDYGDFWVPVEFIVENAAASISPTSSSWSKNDGQLKYSIWPDVLSVKVGDISLAKDKDYSLDTDGNLIINEKFLLTLDNGDYNMVVSTSKGGVTVNLHIGESLKNDGQDYHVYAGTKGLSFVASSAIDFTKGIWIGKANPVLVDPSYYSVTANNKFTLSSDYLNKLTTLGTYYISAYVGDDAEYCTTTFRIISASEAAYTPTTGDNSNLVIWIVLLVLAAVIIVVLLIPYLRKKKAVNAEAQEEAPAETPAAAEAQADEEKKE